MSRTCHNCVYSICDQELWLRWLDEGLTIVPQCANHPRWPGVLHDVPGVPCEHYQPKSPLPTDSRVRWIPLGNGSYAYVDAADYEWLCQWAWHAYSDGYAARCENGKKIYMHRQIMQPPKGAMVDHSDGNRANNCRSNLRVCTGAENMRNRRKPVGSSSRFKGVGYSERRRKWFARISFENELIGLGWFTDEEEAARAYDRKAVELFGPYARVNFPREWPPERRAEVYVPRPPKAPKPRRRKKATRQKAPKAAPRKKSAPAKRRKAKAKR